MRLRRRSLGLLGLLVTLKLRAAPGPQPDTPETIAALAAAAYELFPHRELETAIYRGLAESFVDSDPERASALAGALTAADFVNSPGTGRIEHLRSLENRGDFQALRMHVLMGLYNNLEVTRRFGYQGPSLDQGGYLERGFDAVRWVDTPGSDAH